MSIAWEAPWDLGCVILLLYLFKPAGTSVLEAGAPLSNTSAIAVTRTCVHLRVTGFSPVLDGLSDVFIVM